MLSEKTANLRRVARNNGWWKIMDGEKHEIWTNGELTEAINKSAQTEHRLYKRSKSKLLNFPTLESRK